MEREYPYAISTVSLGGGTGHNSYLRGVVKINQPECNTAIPATWDGKGDDGNGGGRSGKLRISMGVLPPGDIMKSIPGLIEDDEKFQVALRILSRDEADQPLANLLWSEAERVNHSAQEAVDDIRKILGVRGRVLLPSTTDVNLRAESRNGKAFKAEGDIDLLKKDDHFHLLDEVSRIWLSPKPTATKVAMDAIKSAQRIVSPAGSPFTSIFPHLLNEGIRNAILESPAELVVVFNLFYLKKGEDHHLNLASRWLEVYRYYLRDDEYIRRYGKSRINYAVGHDFQSHFSSDLKEGVELYNNKDQGVVEIDKDACEQQAPGMKVKLANLAEYDRDSHLVRYDSDALAKTVFSASRESSNHLTAQRILQAVSPQ